MTLVRAGYLPLDDLPGFLAGATVLAYPSLGEGFGLPVLEAMACGASVLTTRELSLPEVGGDAVAYCGTSVESIASGLAALLGDDERRAALGQAAALRAQGFTWAASAEAHEVAYARRGRGAVTSRRRPWSARRPRLGLTWSLEARRRRESAVRWLVTGAAGMLGQDVVSMLRSRGDEVTAAGRRDLDVTDPDAVDAAVDGHDVVVNCAAWTAVDDAETQRGGRRSGSTGRPRRSSPVRRPAGAPGSCHVSTDYVFDGTVDRAVRRGGPVNPASAYGRTKAAGEWAVRARAAGRHRRPDGVALRRRRPVLPQDDRARRS